MFTHRHYMPILRWNRAERAALHDVREHHRSWMTPLIEIPPAAFRLTGEGADGRVVPELRHAAKTVGHAWAQRPAFLDMRQLPAHLRSPSGRHPISVFWEAADEMGLQVIPVASPTTAPSFLTAVAAVVHGHPDRGFCLRLPLEDLTEPQFDSQVDHLLDCLGAVPQHTDLVIDYGVFSDSQLGVQDALARIPALLSWRTVTVACGAFPKDLQALRPGRHYLWRDEWHRWLENICNPKLERLPAFADYTVQYGQFTEPRKNSNPSASIRYTADDYTVVMRGEGLKNKNGPGHKQYRGNAILLCEQKEFAGQAFSGGDNYIWQVSSSLTSTPGCPETWIRAAINHHITHVTTDIEHLDDLLHLSHNWDH
jgi:Beta protein